MILLGRNLSPFVRRCATLMNLLGISYQSKIVATEQDGELIRQHNPLGRVPALILQDELTEDVVAQLDYGSVIIDSTAIIDYLLEIGDLDHRLIAAHGLERRRTLYISSIAVGTMEKLVAAAYEIIMRPKELVYSVWRERLINQALAGLLELESLAARQGLSAQKGWFGGEQPGLADVNAVVAYDHFNIVQSNIIQAQSTPLLSGLSKRANQQTAFAKTLWSAS